MSFEIHIVVASDKMQANARISALTAGRQHVLLSAGFRSRVSFENLDQPASDRSTGLPLGPVYCAVVRLDG